MEANVTPSPTKQVKLGCCVKFAYALPRFTIRAAYVIIQVYGQLYYMQLGAKLRFMAFYTAIGRALDVITDPAMGWLTDSTRTIFGRRKPYLFIGMFLYTVDTFANVPYYALGMELTSDYDQRNSLYFWQHAFGQFGTMIGGIMPAALSDFMKMDLRDAYAITGWSFGAWYSVGIALTLLLIKERAPPRRSKIDSREASAPLVREMLRIYRNRAFMPWMMAYVLDYAAIGILSTMVPLFSQYVLVEPDSTNCKNQCEEWNPSKTDCTCAKLATEWLGLVMAATFLAAMLSVPFWMLVATKCNKHSAWLIYSWWNACTGPFRIFCGKGSLWLTIILSAINGSAFGGQFIGESVMADLSDYDEFLYGDRAEGMLGVIATLGPKMVLVVCFVVPLASVATAGFRDSVWPEETVQNAAEGLRACEESPHLDACPKLPQPQNDTVLLMTRLGVSIVPTVLALASNFFKCRFPLKRREQLDEILNGIELHREGKSAKDPISGNVVRIVEPSGCIEQEQMWNCEMWGAAIGGNAKCLRQVVDVSLAMQSNNSTSKVIGAATWRRLLVQRARCWLVGGIFCASGSLTATVLTFDMLEKESTSWVPTSLCIVCGSTVVFTIVSALRLKAAVTLSKSQMSIALLHNVLSRGNCDASCCPTSIGATDACSSTSLFLEVPPEPAPLCFGRIPGESRPMTSSVIEDQCSWPGARPGHIFSELRPIASSVREDQCPWHGARPR